MTNRTFFFDEPSDSQRKMLHDEGIPEDAKDDRVSLQHLINEQPIVPEEIVSTKHSQRICCKLILISMIVLHSM